VLLRDSVVTENFWLKALSGVVSGHIYGTDDTPLRWAWTTAYDSLPEDNFSVSTDWSGFYRLSVPFAPLSLTATAAGYGEQREEGITLTPSRPDTEVDFHLPPSGVTEELKRFLPPLLFPNPFSQRTNIRFLLRGKGERKVRVGVYNLQGERIKLIFAGQLPPGPYQFSWRSRDEEGEEAKSGLYFLRLDVGDEEEIKKMFLIR